MHCGADLDDADETARSASDERVARRNRRNLETASEADDSADESLLDPDGLLDNSLTVLVGLVGGALVGVLALVLFGIITQSVWGLLPAGLAWMVGTGYLSTRRTVGEAVRYGCYATALLLVLYPLVSFAPATKGGDFAGRVFLFLVAELLFGVFALGLVGVGRVAGKK